MSDADDFDSETCKNIDNPWTYVDKCSSNLAVAHKSTSICFEKIHKDLEKCSEMSSYFEKSASMQPRTSPPKFVTRALLLTKVITIPGFLFYSPVLESCARLTTAALVGILLFCQPRPVMFEVVLPFSMERCRDPRHVFWLTGPRSFSQPPSPLSFSQPAVKLPVSSQPVVAGCSNIEPIPQDFVGTSFGGGCLVFVLVRACRVNTSNEKCTVYETSFGSPRDRSTANSTI